MASVSTLFTSLVILSITIALLAPTVFADDTNYILYSKQTLPEGESLTNGNYELTMQTDCDLVLSDSGSSIWSTRTSNSGSSCYLTLQDDGDLVVFDGNDQSVWASDTNKGSGIYVLILQSDGNLVIFAAIWTNS